MFRDQDLILLLDNLKAKISDGSLTTRERLCIINLQSKLHMLKIDPTHFLDHIDLWDCLSLGFIMQTMACEEEISS